MNTTVTGEMKTEAALKEAAILERAKYYSGIKYWVRLSGRTVAWGLQSEDGHWKTNNEGLGLFWNDGRGNVNQSIGTCEFALRGSWEQIKRGALRQMKPRPGSLH